jgi:hypothetical protein
MNSKIRINMETTNCLDLENLKNSIIEFNTIFFSSHSDRFLLLKIIKNLYNWKISWYT